MKPYRKKLIEVALPLDAINKASAREKSIRHGHPSTLHLWWARRPLAAARAVIFAQMVDDPSAWPELFPTEEDQEKERQRLFDIIEELVLWESTTNEAVLQRAREEIWKSWRRTCADNVDHPKARELFDPEKLPAFHDPFAGGGSLPLEAQRLGLEAHASDLNPVAILINKAMIEIPPKFAGRSPVNPEWRGTHAREKALHQWNGARGLAADVRYYGKWMLDEAEKRIGHLYPKVEITAAMAEERADLRLFVGQKLTVIAWIWARTVRSPNPAFSEAEVPLASTFMLASRPGSEAYIEPLVGGSDYRFIVKTGKPKDVSAVRAGTKLGRGSSFRCLLSGAPISGDYVKAEGRAGRLGARLMATVVDGDRCRVYLPPTRADEELALEAQPGWTPDVDFFQHALGFRVGNYGMRKWSDLFTARQAAALSTFSDLVQEVRVQIERDLVAGGPDEPGKMGVQGIPYAEAVCLYLAFAVDRVADRHSVIATWDSSPSKLQLRNTFSRQALQMTWDFGEGNPFSASSGTWCASVEWVAKALEFLPAGPSGKATQADASTQRVSNGRIVSTDPPYYDNIGYADLSDFFYVWLRRSLNGIFPELFSTVAVPKSEELVATPARHGGKERAEGFFLKGMTGAMRRLSEQVHSAFPVTIYYAFKQSERDGKDGIASTGWEIFLDAIIRAGFGVSGTWPMRTELGNRMRGMGSNALASSMVLVCRPLGANASTVTRREFITVLKAELPAAIAHLRRGNIAPVDLAQAAIGPGMAVYTRYARVLEADGALMAVRTALQLINQTLDECFSAQEGEFDGDTRFAVTWFETHGMDSNTYGEAENLAKARNVSVQGVVEAGVLEAKGGKARLLKRDELPNDWDPATDTRLTVWEAVQHLIKRLESHGESGAAELLAKLGPLADAARDLAYRLYSICERKKWAEEALHYNSVIVAWPELVRLASQRKSAQPQQQTQLDV